MENTQLFKEIAKYLDHLSNNVGKTVTEYDWRECCGLIRQMEVNGLIYNPRTSEDEGF